MNLILIKNTVKSLDLTTPFLFKYPVGHSVSDYLRQEVLRLFDGDCSDTNPDPSKKSRQVIEILDYEALLLKEDPNLWLGYNAFNSVLHGHLKKTFSQQEKLDKELFQSIYEMVV